MSRLRSSGLIVPVEAARELVAPWLDLVPASSRELPPHVTALWPFLPADGLDAALEGRLGAFLSGLPAFDFALTRVGGFADVVFLAPEPAERFVALTRALWDEWPECPPFGGAYDEVVPYLTVALDPAPGQRREIETVVAPLLPLAARAAEVLLVEEDEGGTLVVRRRFTLGGPAA
jgi:hypothetical protein